jgi:hypothetical protein
MGNVSATGGDGTLQISDFRSKAKGWIGFFVDLARWKTPGLYGPVHG